MHKEQMSIDAEKINNIATSISQLKKDLQLAKDDFKRVHCPFKVGDKVRVYYKSFNGNLVKPNSEEVYKDCFIREVNVDDRGAIRFEFFGVRKDGKQSRNHEYITFPTNLEKIENAEQ